MALREPPELPARKDVLRLQKKKKLSSSYRDLFAKTDIDSDGTLSEGEVATLLTTHGIDASVAYVRQLFEVFDTDGSGTISGP
eukprot:COSAG02_NODE_41672_length_392_cov_0.706485_1_plen_82_part_10